MRILFTIKDKVAKKSGPVFEAVNLEVAKRICRNLLKENKGYDPKELDLICLGQVVESGDDVYISYETEQTVINFTDLYNDEVLTKSQILEDKLKNEEKTCVN